MASRSVTFSGARGQKLAGRLAVPIDGEPRACVILAHCFTCTSDFKAVAYLSRALTERQMAVLRFDFTGIGESEGEFADAGFSADVDDVVAAGAFLERELIAPSLLVGHSLGGAAAIAAAHRMPTVRAVCTIGSPADIGNLRNLIAMDAALLIFHDPDDEVVSIENAARLYTGAHHPKSFVSLPGAGHMLEHRSDAEFVGSVLAAWAARYVPTSAEPGEAPERPTRVTASTGEEGFRTEIGVRAHTLLADEPVAVGGTDAGPTPYDLLAAALGACTTMTLQMYARGKGWPLKRAVTRIRHSRVYSEDQGSCPDRPVRMDQLHRELELVGDLTNDQRQRLVEIADRCPVHRTLDAGVAVHTTLAEIAADDPGQGREPSRD